MKHFVEAYEAYEQMLAKHEAQIAPADKKAVQQALDELGVLTATVIVDVSEPDAEIELDGKSAGRSPMTKPKRVAATGGHTVRVSKPGFTHVEQPFTVDSQQNKKIDVKLEVEKTVGHVVVREQNGRDVHVFIDGHDQGPAPWEGDLPAGEHVIEAKSARFASDARKVVVAQKDRLDLALDATALQGRLRVTTVPANATIAVDGNTVGTGAWEGELAEGTHRIEVSLPGQTPQTREIALGRGQVMVQEIPIVSAIATTRHAGLRGDLRPLLALRPGRPRHRAGRLGPRQDEQRRQLRRRGGREAPRRQELGLVRHRGGGRSSCWSTATRATALPRRAWETSASVTSRMRPTPSSASALA